MSNNDKFRISEGLASVVREPAFIMGCILIVFICMSGKCACEMVVDSQPTVDALEAKDK